MKRFIHDRNTVDTIYQYRKNDNVPVESDSDLDYNDYWEEEASKLVEDSDGFLTDYTLWHNVLTDKWVTIFGDKDLYTPVNDTPDMEFDDEDEARDWFADYSTFDEDDDGYY